MEKRNRIPIINGIFMVSVALLFDLLQFFLTLIFIGIILDWMVSLFAWLTFYLWFKARGVNISDSVKKWAAQGCEILIEAIPVLNALPGWTLGTALMVIITRKEDALHNKKVKNAEQQALETKPGQKPLDARLEAPNDNEEFAPQTYQEMTA